jgi:hypothetical protein
VAPKFRKTNWQLAVLCIVYGRGQHVSVRLQRLFSLWQLILVSQMVAKGTFVDESGRLVQISVFVRFPKKKIIGESFRLNCSELAR